VFFQTRSNRSAFFKVHHKHTGFAHEWSKINASLSENAQLWDVSDAAQNDIPQITSVSYRGHQFDLLRLDLLPGTAGGNKVYKLRYNLQKATFDGHDTILTFGGAWSNHILATAEACREKGFKSIGVIRGEESDPSSATLNSARDLGMQLLFVSREEYREKDEDFFKSWLRSELGRFYLIPEGGSNYLGVQGCTEILDARSKKYGLIGCACGTGATLAGIIQSLNSNQRAIGFSALKGDWMRDEVLKHLMYSLGSSEAAEEYTHMFELIHDDEFGGYGRYDDRLLSFIQNFYHDTGIKLDPVYTGKMVYRFLDLLETGSQNSTQPTLLIHTGGLQGAVGIEEKSGVTLFD
jgi:1-aminocyclopropane-1-carboxylate deaminase